MRRRPALPALLAPCLALLCACGAGARSRPALIASFPVDGAVLPAPIAELVLTYDRPVRILNDGDARLRSGGFGIPLVPTLDPLDPTRVRLAPAEGWALVPASTTVLTVSQGLVVDADDQYSLDEYVVTFTTAPPRPIQVGAPGVVVALDPVTLAGAGSVPTPAGTDPEAIATIERPAGPRTFVQLSSGAGTGQALAYFDPGAGAMTQIPLTTSGADLGCHAPALVVGPRATFVYAAFRDAAAGPSGGVRLVRVDTATATESASLLLAAVPSSVFTTPTALVFDPDRGLLLVVCADGADGTVAFVDEGTFVELDRDPLAAGVQGVGLPQGAGPAALADGRLHVADPFSSDLTSVDPDSGATSVSGAGAAGASTGLARTPDQRELLQPLLGVPDLRAIQRRVRPGYGDGGTYLVSDDVGGTPTGATGLRTLAQSDREALGARFLALLDSDVLAAFRDTGTSFAQVDLDEATDGVQCLPLPGAATGAYVVGVQVGAYQP